MLGFEFNVIVDSGNFPEVTIYRRVVTPFFYFKLKTKEYTYKITRSPVHWVLIPLLMYIPVPAPKGKTYETGWWGLTSNSTSRLLEKVKGRYSKLVDL